MPGTRRLSRLAAAAYAVCLATAGAHAEADLWHVAERAAPVAIDVGATFHRFTVAGRDRVDFQVVAFDARRCALRVVDQADRERAGTLGRAMRMIPGAVAGVNGGFFTPAFQPLGLCIAEGRRIGEWQRSSLLGGVVLVRRGRPLLVWREELENSAGVTDLLQAGPRLVNHGRPVAGLSGEKRRSRTFVATDGDARWLVGICSRASLDALARVLATPGLLPGLEIDRALNLDGGSSTGLWWRGADGKERYERELATVRNFLAVVPR